MIRVFVGYDKAETAAYQVCCYSIIKNCSVPVSITPLKIGHFPYFTNAHPLQSTEFAFTRFLVPSLCDFKGHALFMDADMLVRGDLADLFNLADPEKAVQVVKHNYQPKDEVKFLNQAQTKYSRKNWSSVILFNNEKCEVLKESYVNNANGLYLHQFQWLENDEIGSLPKSWNYLVGEDHDGQHTNPDIVHFTRGGPYFEDYRDCAFAGEWRQYFKESISVLDTKQVEV